MSNKGFQKHNIEKMLKNQGITDFDTEAHIDRSLSMSENIDNLEDELGMSLRKDDVNSAQVRERRESSDLKQARRRHEARPEDNQRIDERIDAEKTFDTPLTEEEWDKWSENPDEFDVEGVDGDLF